MSAKAQALADGKNVLAQHTTLGKELAAAHSAEHEERRDAIRHEAAADAFNETRMRLYVDKARGRLDGLQELNEAEQGWQEARRQTATAKEQQAAAHSAITTVQAEIQALYEAHLDVFAAEAERFTQEAAKLLADLAGPYEAAWVAWHQAVQAWAPLAPTITHAVLTANANDGIWRDQTKAHLAARVPELPLPPPGFLGGIPAARPPAMEPADAAEADSAA
ncbi:MAG: hypothetical protein QOG15_2056 [Solirubrobacteraceae bacterium]|jgi:hypothetical protein|nr:hypothetical protein [Solirubrobacteraceae bacterium]